MLRRLKAATKTGDEATRLREELAEACERAKLWKERAERAEAELSKRDSGAFDAARIVWLFGTGRTGSTWLASVLGGLPGCEVWREPLVGELFGRLYYERASEKHRKSPHFVLGAHEDTWLRSVRSFVLEGAAARFPGAQRLVVKEPNGSSGAPILARALPESALILLVRDPRDAVASALDATSASGWRRRSIEKRGRSAPDEPDVLVASRARIYLRDVGRSLEAYRAHGGPKTLVRYEDLIADTLGETRRLCSDLGISAEEELARAVEERSWQSIPPEEKGPGKFYRKATPGGWKEDLSLEQIEVVESITVPLLEEFYPGEETYARGFS